MMMGAESEGIGCLEVKRSAEAEEGVAEPGDQIRRTEEVVASMPRGGLGGLAQYHLVLGGSEGGGDRLVAEPRREDESNSFVKENQGTR